MSAENILLRAYADFNAREIEAVLSVMHPDVVWANGMEGGTVLGHAGIRDYWTRQWSVVDPHVEPLQITTEPDGRFAVLVRQRVRDLTGNLLHDGVVQHVYRFENDLVKSMEIREPKLNAGDPA
jgi:ketosteroid isomerase-like protein